MKMIKNLGMLVIIAFLLWIVVSWSQVCILNSSLEPHPNYSDWNFWFMIENFD